MHDRIYQFARNARASSVGTWLVDKTCAGDSAAKWLMSVQTYSQTVVPRPRGKMINPNASGIDLVKKNAPVDESTRPVSLVGARD